jgi:protein involved in polysaccharide export with SLBB domain
MRKLSAFLVSLSLLTTFLAMPLAALAQTSSPLQGSPAPVASETSRINLAPETIQQIQEGLPPGVRQQLQKVSQGKQPPDQSPASSSPEEAQGSDGQDYKKKTSTQLQKGLVAKPALIEQLFRNNYGSDLTGDLSQFGYTLFSSGSITPSSLAVPDANYVLGPGDTMQIRIWGASIDAEFTGIISREGYINIPRVGIVAMAGVKFGQAEKVIRKEAEKYVQGINLSVSLARLRSVEVFVVGEVPNPGLQLVPAFSSALEGLLSSGGVNKSGSLRTIQLFRNNKLFKTIDLYELLLAGSRASDVMLQDRDVIFVPPIGKTAAVAGAIAKGAIFELKEEKSLADLITLGGGLLPQGFSGRIYLRRFEGNNQFSVQDLTDALAGNRLKEMPLQAGDLLEINYLGSQRPQVVRLTGNVWREDVFTSRPELKLSDILTSPDLLKPEAITDFAMLHRYDAGSASYQAIKIPLRKVFSKEFDLPMQPYDRIEILAKANYGISEPVRIGGAVWKPGDYEFTPGLTLKDLVAQAGGTRFGANLERVDISRQKFEKEQTRTDHYVATLGQDFTLQPFDYVFVRAVKDADIFKNVTLNGEVRYPGTYRIQDGEKLSDLLERAGGFTEYAYFYGAVFTSSQAKIVQQKSLDKLLDDLEVRVETALSDQARGAETAGDANMIQAQQAALRRLLEKLRKVGVSGRMSLMLASPGALKGSPYDFTLENGDSLLVPKRPNFVSVVGSVYTPNSFLFQPDLTLGDYLAKAGGPTESAAPKYIYVLKANGEVVARSNDHLLFRSFESTSLMPGDTIVVPEDVDKIPYLRLVRDVSDIIFKIAVTTGLVLAL